MCDHLSGRRVAAPLDAAYPGLIRSPRERMRMKTSRLPPSADGFVPAWPCSRRGLPDDLHCCKCRWSLTPPFHSYCPHPCAPLPLGEGMEVRERLVSVALFRQVRSLRRLPHPGDYPTPCSMECGLSSMATTRHRDRPTDLRQVHHTRKAKERQQREPGSNERPTQIVGIDKFENEAFFSG
ncbi:MAG: hypothetical protein MHPDNHAH_03116 [Anaerolineales bacterium]|nr:hypothetical protein [Anaerolineales bacterium]